MFVPLSKAVKSEDKVRTTQQSNKSYDNVCTTQQCKNSEDNVRTTQQDSKVWRRCSYHPGRQQTRQSEDTVFYPLRWRVSGQSFVPPLQQGHTTWTLFVPSITQQSPTTMFVPSITATKSDNNVCTLYHSNKVRQQCSYQPAWLLALVWWQDSSGHVINDSSHRSDKETVRLYIRIWLCQRQVMYLPHLTCMPRNPQPHPP